MHQSELMVEPTWTPKETSPKQAIRYNSRIIHQVEPIQKQLATSLDALKETTSDYISYIPLGKLGVTLATLDPVVKQVLGADKKGAISEDTRRHFEAELNEEFEVVRGKTCEVDGNNPLRLYGKHKNRLGISISNYDTGLFGERVLMERYIRKEYPTVSPRFGDEVLDWEPHVTIGTIRPESFTPESFDELYDDTFGFIMGLAEAVGKQNHERFRIENISERIAFPEELSLGGLKVVCDKQVPRAF